MQHATVGNLRERVGTTWLVYGPSGAGKTPLVSLFPHPWIWDFEGGVQSALRDDIIVSRPENYAEVLALLQIAQQATPGVVKLGNAEYPFCTLVVDTTTELARLFERSARGGKEQASLAEWYLTVERTRNTLRALRNLSARGLNVVFVTHEQYIKSELEVYQGMPDMPGKELPNDVPRLMDVVAHLTWKQTANGLVRELVCEPHGVYIGRDRRNLITRMVVDFKDHRGVEKMLVEKGGAKHCCKPS